MNEIKAFIILMFLVFLVEAIISFVSGAIIWGIVMSIPTIALSVILWSIWRD